MNDAASGPKEAIREMRVHQAATKLGWWCLHVAALTCLTGCADPAQPHTGPTFQGRVSLEGRPVPRPEVTGVARACTTGLVLSEGRTTGDQGGSYRLVLPLPLRSSPVCVHLSAPVGDTIAALRIESLVFDDPGQTHQADLDETARVIVYVRRPGG